MLIHTMSAAEATREIHKDWEKSIRSATRLAAEYDKERKKLKINKSDSYFKSYTIKSALKNHWIFIFSKAPAADQYKGPENVKCCMLIYYYTKVGLRVFKLLEKEVLSVYNGHVFTRYQERMSLQMKDPLEIIKHFFSNNVYCTASVITRDGKKLTLSICKDGLLLGELREDTSWVLHKTFVSRNLTGKNLRDEEVKLIIALGDEIKEEISHSRLDVEAYRGWLEIYKTYVKD
jgi:hypothetical protein